MRIRATIPVAIPLAALFLIFSAVRLSAQTVIGRVVESGGEVGIPTVFVSLIDEAGAGDIRHASALTDSVGRFVIRAPAAGRYRLRAERLGHETTTSSPITLAAGQSLDYLLEVMVAPIALEGISVQSKSQCHLRPEEGQLTALLWEEARKALTVAAWAEDERILHYDVVQYERDLEPGSLRVLREQRRPRLSIGTSPFSALPAEDLSSGGYFETLADGSMHFYGPDAHVLLSESFLSDHCFRARGAPPQLGGMIGLEFEPRRGRTLPDIQGVLWLDAGSSELRFIEYVYTGLPASLDKRDLGGRIEFEQVPTGEWAIRRWWIRMPQMGLQAGVRGRPGESDRVLLGIRETGGEIVGIRPQSMRVQSRSRAGGATLEGVVFDTLAGAPLADAVVFISGTSFHGATDADGFFRIEGVPAGEHVVSYQHDILNLLELYPSPVSISVAEAETHTIELAVPSQSTLLARACPAEGEGSGGTLVGTVRDARTGQILPGVEVVLERGGWVRRGEGQGGVHYTRTGGDLTVKVEVDGYYRACNIPTREPIQAYALIGDQRSNPVRVHLRSGRIERHDFTIDAPAELVESLPPLVGGLTGVRRGGEGARGERGGAPGSVQGRIESISGAPVAGVVAYLSGTDLAAETDARGEFVIDAVPAGSYSLVWFDAEFDPEGDLVEPLGVRVEAGGTTQALIQVAGIDERLSGCSAGDRVPGSVVVHGTARDADSGTPLGGARVQLVAAGDTLETSSDESGHYRFCAASPGQVEILGHLGALAMTSEALDLAPDGLVQYDLEFSLQRSVGRTAASRGAELFGRVVDEDGDPVNGVSIELVGMDRHQTSNSSGHVIFRDLEPGTYSVRATHIGYLESEGTLVATAGERTEFELHLSTRAIELEGIVVVTARRDIMLSPFYDRVAKGIGSFFTREVIEQRNPQRVSDLLRQAGVEVSSGSLYMGRTGCVPMIYLDGVRITQSQGTSPSPEDAIDAVNLIPPVGVEGVEVFQGAAQIPPEFSGSTSACGVIAIWTRRGT